MKNLIAGVSLITASAVCLIAFVLFKPRFPSNDFFDIFFVVVWLVYFITGLFFLILARDEPDP